MNTRNVVMWGIVVLATVASAGIFLYVMNIDAAQCPVTDISANVKTAINVVDAVVNLDIQLATALLGLGAAVLVGFRANFTPSPFSALLLLLSLLAFAQSVLYGIWWKSNVATVWYKECLKLFSGDFVQRPYEFHFYFFVAGFLLLAMMVVIGFAQRLNPNPNVTQP